MLLEQNIRYSAGPYITGRGNCQCLDDDDDDSLHTYSET